MCEWESKDGAYKCNRTKFKNSKYCLFHEPQKRGDDAKLFWDVINLNPFVRISQSTKSILNNGFHFLDSDFEQTALINHFLFNFFTSSRPNRALNRAEVDSIESEIKASIIYDCTSKGINGDYYSEVFKEWENSKIHGQLAGYFRGFQFPDNSIFSYNYISLNSDNPFMFREVVFEGQCVFEDYNFGENDVYFIDVEIDHVDYISFKNAVFNRNVFFSNVNLGVSLNIDTFNHTTFNGNKVIFKGGSILSLKGIRLSKYTDLIIKNDVKISNILNPNKTGDTSLRKFDELLIVNAEKETYAIAKNQALFRNDYNNFSEYLYKEYRAERKNLIKISWEYYKERSGNKVDSKNIFKYLKDKHFYTNILKWSWKFLSEKTIGYGEKPVRALLTSFFIIFIFGVIYKYFGLIHSDSFQSSLFFSVVTYTTVGYGNEYPICGWGEIVCAIEMFLGVTFIAIWTATLIRKMIR